MTSTITYHVGDVRDVMAELADGSVHLVVTSPPFLALRSYLPADHPDKHREIGSEATPAAFIDTMLGLSADWRRLLAPWGSIAVEIGDTYSGSTATGGDCKPAGEWTKYQRGDLAAASLIKRRGDAWPLSKSLTGIPTLYTWSLAYGRNLLTGDPSPAGSWRVRNLLTWTRPNPPVGALGDKFRPATSFVTVACTSDKRWFDLDAVRTMGVEPPKVRSYTANNSGAQNPRQGWAGPGSGADNPAGAPPLDWWDANANDTDDWQPLHRLPTQPYAGSHYATFPVALPQRLIEAMCPREVCTVCGTPRRRIVGAAEYVQTCNGKTPATLDFRDGTEAGVGVRSPVGTTGDSVTRVAPTLGWSDCGHDAYQPGIVLDPFGGSGTTAVAAARAGRDAVLIDLDHRNVDLARQRIADQLRIVTEHHDGDTWTWTVEAPLPAQREQIDGQRSIFDELEAM